MIFDSEGLSLSPFQEERLVIALGPFEDTDWAAGPADRLTGSQRGSTWKRPALSLCLFPWTSLLISLLLYSMQYAAGWMLVRSSDVGLVSEASVLGAVFCGPAQHTAECSVVEFATQAPCQLSRSLCPLLTVHCAWRRRVGQAKAGFGYFCTPCP